MALFAFDAVRQSGDPVSAQLEAASEAEAVERVREQGLILLRIQTAAAAAITSHKKDGHLRAALCFAQSVARTGRCVHPRSGQFDLGGLAAGSRL